MQKGKEQGIPESKMRPYAIAEGMIEGGVEGATDYFGGKLLGLDKTLISNPLKNTIKQMLAPTIRGQVVRFAKTAPLEIGTEMIQNSSEEWLSQRAGLSPESTPWEAAKQSIGPALGMTILYNIGGMGFHKIHQAQLQRALFTDNVSEKYRSRAVSEVESGILDYAKTYEKSDPVAAEQYKVLAYKWGQMAEEFKGKAIPFNADLASYREKTTDAQQYTIPGVEGYGGAYPEEPEVTLGREPIREAREAMAGDTTSDNSCC